MNCKQKKYLAIIESGWVGYEEFSDRRAEVDNTPQDMQNSSYPTKAEFNNCFIIPSKYFQLFCSHYQNNWTSSSSFLG